MTCRPQLIKLLLAISLCLADLDLIQVKTKYVTEIWKNMFLFVLPQGPTSLLSQLTCDEPGSSMLRAVEGSTCDAVKKLSGKHT